MIQRLLKRWLGRSERAIRRILEEAHEVDFEFHIYNGEDRLILSKSQVRLLLDRLVYQEDNAESFVLYSDMNVQVLAKSKIVNIISQRGRRLWMNLAWIPLAMALFLFQVSYEPPHIPSTLREPFLKDVFDPVFTHFSITRAEVRGFSIAILFLSYLLLPVIIWLTRRNTEQIAIRATSLNPGLFEKLEKAADVEDYFSKLIQVNLTNMEQYYLLVRTQSDKSYKLTQLCAAAGFCVLITGILFSLVKGASSSTTIITISSGVLIEFISAVFFYIYNKTVAQLNTYHEKLISVQDTMLALKVAQIVKDQNLKDKTMAYLTEALTSKLMNPLVRRGKSGEEDNPETERR